jgi:hypothetical protein
VISKLNMRSLLATVAATGLVLFAAPAFALTDVDHDTLSFVGIAWAGDSLSYQHTVDPINDPSIIVTSIDSAWLYMGLIDNVACPSLGGCSDVAVDTAAIDLNSFSWDAGPIRVTIAWGDVTAEADLLNNNGVLEVVVSNSADEGGIAVMWSRLTTRFSYELADGVGGAGGGANPMPEPSAALVFAMGALLIHRTVRRGHRRS